MVKSAESSKKCPKCGGSAGLLVPLKAANEEIAVYGCTACGHTFNHEGKAFIDGPSHLRDVFRGATMGQETMAHMLKGEKFNPATKALLQAQVIEYGLQMWFDGLKQGLLLGAIRETKDGEIRNSRGGPDPES